MKMQNLLAVLAAFTLAASTGCLGGLDEIDPVEDPTPDPDPDPEPDPDPDPEPDPDPTNAEQLFNDTVMPQLQRCAGEACHSGAGTFPLKFLGTDTTGSTWYESITSYPSVTGGYDPLLANVILQLETVHEGLQPWTDIEKDVLTDWLLAEREVRGLDPVDPDTGDPLPPGDSIAALAEWSGCMTKANWDQANMGDWADKQSDEGPCQACHNNGLMRFNTNDNNDTMFTMNRYELYIISFFTVEVGVDGTHTVIPAYDKLMRMGNGTTLHPEYNMDLNNQDFQNLEEFYNLTMQAKQNGQCGPAAFPQP